MTTRTILSLALAAGLGACAAPGAVGPTVSRPVVPYTSAGLERVIGQDAACEKVAAVVQRARAGLRATGRPSPRCFRR